jgi:glycerol-3-phosphate dehydrogenase (NAD(P)+)
VAERLSVEMPICREVFRVVHEAKPIREAVQDLMSRDMRFEGD